MLTLDRHRMSIRDLTMTTQPTSLPEFPSNPSCSILIVDDDANQLTLFSLMLRHLACQVFTATDGFQALDLIEHEKPDVVLLDLALPGISGQDVLRTIRADPQFSHIKIILITASLARLTSEDAALADDVIRKPVTRPQLEQAIHDTPLARTRPAPPIAAEVGKRRA